jgi:hypothetical protein
MLPAASGECLNIPADLGLAYDTRRSMNQNLLRMAKRRRFTRVAGNQIIPKPFTSTWTALKNLVAALPVWQ